MQPKDEYLRRQVQPGRSTVLVNRPGRAQLRPRLRRCGGPQRQRIRVRAGRGYGFPVTRGAFQTTFNGCKADAVYGYDDACVAKLDAKGRLVWASYVGTSQNARSLAVDSAGDVYVPLGWGPANGTTVIATGDPSWYGGPAFTSAYQKTRGNGLTGGIAKISRDGTAVKWATWLGGKGANDTLGTVKVDADRNVYVLCNTEGNDLPAASGAAQSANKGKMDLYLAKLSPDGSELLYGTYFGGSGDEYNETHNLAVDKNGQAYVAVSTNSPNMPTTQGAFQKRLKGKGNWAVAKFSPAGALLACTHVGGSGLDNVDGVSVDDQGNVYLSGTARSADFPVTADARQKTKGGGSDAVFVKLKADFCGVEYSTFVGGEGNEMGRANCIDSAGNSYMVGQSDGRGWPAVNACQPAYNGGPMDVIVAVFSRVAKGTP